jgi:hypothetical protein
MKKSLALFHILTAIVVSACGAGVGQDPRIAHLKSIEVSPQNAVMEMGQTLELKAIALFDDGSRQDVSNTVEWTPVSLNSQAISFSNSAIQLNAGVIKAADVGVFTFIVSVGDVSSMVSVNIVPPSQQIAQEPSHDSSPTQNASMGTIGEVISSVVNSISSGETSPSPVPSPEPETPAQPEQQLVTVDLPGQTQGTLTLEIPVEPPASSQAEPNLTAVSSSYDEKTDSTLIVLTGENFDSHALVTVDAQQCGDTKVVASGKIVCIKRGWVVNGKSIGVQNPMN